MLIIFIVLNITIGFFILDVPNNIRDAKYVYDNTMGFMEMIKRENKEKGLRCVTMAAPLAADPGPPKGRAALTQQPKPQRQTGKDGHSNDYRGKRKFRKKHREGESPRANRCL